MVGRSLKELKDIFYYLTVVDISTSSKHPQILTKGPGRAFKSLAPVAS